MMYAINFNVDLGQILLLIVGVVISIIGWFIKKEITSFGTRIDKHDEVLFSLTGQVQRLIGYYEATKNHIYEDVKPPSSGIERRRSPRT